MSNLPPTYILALSHSFNRASIESAKPGIPFDVLVIPADEPTAKPTVAVGLVSADGTTFDAKVGAGEEDGTYIQWTWSTLLEELRKRRTEADET